MREVVKCELVSFFHLALFQCQTFILFECRSFPNNYWDKFVKRKVSVFSGIKKFFAHFLLLAMSIYVPSVGAG